MKRLVLAGALGLLFAGCATQTFTVNGGGGMQPDLEIEEHFFVRGISQKKHLNAADVCRGADRVARVETEQTFVDVLLDVVTAGIYSPRTARVYCRR